MIAQLKEVREGSVAREDDYKIYNFYKYYKSYIEKMKPNIFAVLGVLPEPAGFAAAKFSRTPVYKSYQDWVVELTEEGAEKFYNSFYFQYGHASIADLSHLMVIIENVSVPARFSLLDDQLIDVQSRSTRYVDYSKCQMIVPPEIKKDKEILKIYRQMCCELVDLYREVISKVSDYYAIKYRSQKPADMDEEAYVRTLSARSIDVARYLLPGGIPKSFGIMASARTWERIITKMLSSDLLEFQQIGRQLQKAICRQQAFNPANTKIDQLKVQEQTKEQIKKIAFGKNVGLPTLVKYARSKDYPKNIYKNLRKFLLKLDLPKKTDEKFGVELFEKVDPEIDLATTLLYRISNYSYGQLLKAVKKADKKLVRQIIDYVYQSRGERDPVVREAAVGTLTYDVCIDIGAYRDLSRHRNVIHIMKDVAPVYGFEMPEEIKKVGLDKEHQLLMKKVVDVYNKIEKKYRGVGQYILPQATRRRVLMRMTPWQLQYLTELRTKPQGHFSYRQIAWQMYDKFNKKYPDWGKHFRVTDPKVVDFFKR